MIELLVSISTFLGIFLVFIFCIPYFKIYKLVIFFFLSFYTLIFLCSEIKYESHDLWKNNEKFEAIHKTTFLPIKNIHFYIVNDILNFEFEKTDGIYSINKNNTFPKECLKDYFIKSDDECPITDIILEKSQKNSYEGYTEIEIFPGKMYIYYSNNKLDGELYKDVSQIPIECDEDNKNIFESSKSDNCLYIEFQSDFNYLNVSYIKAIEEIKKSNPFIKLKNYSQYSDIVCIILCAICFIYSGCEPTNYKLCTIFSIFNWIFTVIITVLFLLRYLLFIKIKDYYNKYEDGYSGKYFNYDSIPISILIAMIIIYILYLIIPMKCHFCYENCEQISNSSVLYPCFNSEEKTIKISVFILLFPINLIYIIIFGFDVVNDNKIKDNYNYIYKNWEISPINSIIPKMDFDSTFSLTSERLTKYNYFNILERTGKICGKDNKGNNLYFPMEEECPINGIYISEEKVPKQGYTIKEISNDYRYIYYTNQNINEKIILDVGIKSKQKEILYNITYYEGIELNLKSYLDENFKKNIEKFKTLIKVKYALFGISIPFIIYFYILLFFEKFENKGLLVLSIFFLIILFIYLIILSICLKINIKYVQNFMNKIDCFKSQRCDYILNYFLIIIIIYFIIYDIFILIYKFLLKNDCLFIEKIFEKEEKNPLTLQNGQNPQDHQRPKETTVIKVKKKPPPEKPKPKCVICLTNPPAIVLAPCGHKCYCKTCFEQTKDRYNFCPLCKGRVQSAIDNIFDV